MSVVLNEVRRATYFDSIVLMRISRQITGLPGVEEAGVILGTPANKDILRDAGILGPEGDGAEPGDLILALRAKDAAAGAAALAEAKRLLEAPREAATQAGLNALRRLRTPMRHLPHAHLPPLPAPRPLPTARAPQ